MKDVDSGYAWVILAGCYVMYLIVMGSVKTYGILFSEIDEYYGVGSGPVSIIGSLLFLLMFTAGPFANYLAVRTSFRTVTIVGGLFLGLGYSASCFIERLELLFLTLGISAGLGYGLTFTPCSTILNYYFERRRALANGITASASGIGSIGLSFLFKYLIETYSLKPALIIIGGLLLNVCAAACLFKQPETLIKRKAEGLNKRRKDKHHYGNNILNAEEGVGIILKETLAGDKEEHLHSTLNEDEEGVINIEETIVEWKNKKLSCGPDFNFSLFRNSRFSLYWAAFMLCVAGYGSNFILIPSQIRALGYGKLSVSTAVAITGGSEIFARIFAGWLADKSCITPKKILMVCYFISAVFTCITPHIQSLYYMYFYAAIIGVFPASFWSLFSVIVIEVVGMADFPSAIGLVSLALALGYSVSQVAVGWLKYQTGDWELFFYVTSILFLIPAILMFIDPLVIPQVKQVRLGKVNVTVIEHKTITNGKDTGTMPPASEKESDSFIVGKDTGNMKRSKKNEKI